MRGTTTKNNCLIIGAGMSGLIAAQILQAKKIRVQVIDKGRGVGGRMATRRFSGGVFDHGTQFFTVREPRFATYVQEWQRHGIVRKWSRGFASDTGLVPSEAHPRYIASEGMTSIPKFLAQDLDIHTATRALRVLPIPDGWIVETDQNETFLSHALLITAPVPQSLELLTASGVLLEQTLLSDLEQIQYDPCLCVLAALDGPNQLPEPGAVQLAGEPLSWIGDNHRKGISPEGYAVTLHAGAEFSRDHWTDPDAEIASALIEAARPWITSGVDVYQVKRWRYARPSVLYQSPFFCISHAPPLLLAGDAFVAPRVEGAAISGIEAANELLALLK